MAQVMARSSLCKRQFVMIISAIVIMCKLLATAHADDDYYYDYSLDYLNTKTSENECISLPVLEHGEVGERGGLIKETQTSFIPSKCESKGNEESEIKFASSNRIKRSVSPPEGFHLDSLHSLPHDEIRLAQAKIMKRYMNASVNPCDDFYSYACGNWAKYNEIPQDKVASDTFEILRESLDEALKNLLMNDDKEATKHQKPKNHKRNRQQSRETGRSRRKSAEMKAKNLFRSCMNYEIIEKRGIEPLLELLDKFGGWPLLNDDWDEKNFDWLN
jgi:Peptidase family M13